MRRFAWLLGFAVLIALGSDKALTGTASSIGGGDRWQFRLRLSAPEPDVQGDPNSPGAMPVLSIPAFDSIPFDDSLGTGRSHPVPMPVKVVRVAIPEGVEVSLHSLQAPRRLLKGVRLGGGKATGQGWPGAHVSPTAAKAVEDRPASPSPSAKSEAGSDEAVCPYVRLGRTGYIRFQKFVEIVYSPVVPLPGTDDLEFYPDIDLSLEVDGVDWDEIHRATASIPPDPHFEDLYRQTFVNYDEGRAFRTRGSLNDRFAAQQTFSPGSGPGASLVPPKPYPFAGATTPIYRVIVNAEGIYRLSWSYLLGAGTGVAPGLAGASPAAFKMMSEGVEIPIRVVTAVPGTFASGDYIEFYGKGMLDETKLILNAVVSGSPDIMQVNDFTDENAYFLFAEPGTRSRIADLAGPFNAGLPLETAFTGTVHREYDMRFIPDGVSDPFYQFPEHTVNLNRAAPDPNAADCGYSNPGVQTRPPYFGPAADPNSTTCAACDLNLPAADPNGGANVATVRVRMRGLNSSAVSPDHMTVVQVGTTASRSSTLCWDGEISVEQTVSLAQSGLAGSGIYIGQPGLTTTAGAESVILDWIRVENYRQALRLTGNQVLASFTNIARTWQISGFPSGTASDMIVYDLSRTVAGSTVPAPRRVTSGTITQLSPGDFAYKFSLSEDTTLAGGAPRLFAAAGTGGFRVPVRVTPVPVVDLTATTNAADMIVITNPNVVGTPPSAAFSNYIAHREAVSGLDLTVVMMSDIYDQFSSGVVTPEAIRSFLAYAFDNWRGPGGLAAAPAYVLLLGDSSLDYKNILGNAFWVNDVPTYIMYQSNFFLDYYASDTFLSAVIGADQFPDFHVGRITARNPSEAASILSKLTNYDNNPPAGAWRATGLFLADKGNNAGETTEFESISSRFADTYFVAPFSSHKLYFDDPNYANGTNPTAWRTDYVAKADAGAALTSYIGHGNFDDWGLAGLFSGANMPELSATGRPSFIINENCLIGGFHFGFGTALGENFMNAVDKSAVAVLAPSGLSFSTAGDTINTAIYGRMFGLTRERRFGDLVTAAKVALSLSLTDMQGYVLLGDPAQRLILPAPRPPGNFAAVTDLNGRVDLTWTPSPDAGVLTRIYRREVFLSNYVLLTPGGVSGTAYSDTSAINGKSYFYRAVSFDPSGPFEGGVTNLNSTCNFTNPPASGPDCVWAIPRNPNPPAPPLGVVVGNPGSGDRLLVSWAASPEPDVSFYTIRYGTTSGGPYPSSLNVTAPGTGASVGGLVTGTPYYFVVTATNFSGLTSGLSLQASGLPQVFDGVAPPDPITTLTLRRSTPSPDSIELMWTPPALDIYGGPTQVGSFSIFRGLLPTFAADASTRITTITNPSAVSYTDPGSFTTSSNYFYLVTASDTDGFSSGAGRQLPAGISDLGLAVNGANLQLTWTPVTLDIDGNPTNIAHYTLYRDSVQVGRERIEMLSPLVPVIVGSSVLTPIPPGGLVYYSVIAVDVKGNKSPF